MKGENDFLKHLILYEIQRVKPCPYRLLFDDDYINILKTSEEFVYSNIYFFSRQKKLRFNVDKTSLINKGTVKTELVIGAKETKEVIVSLWDLVPKLSTICKSKEEYEELVAQDDYYWNCELNYNESNDTQLCFKHRFGWTDEYFDVLVSPENFEYNANLDLQNPQEVVYIGQSFRMLDRIQSHKTLHKAVSKLKDSESLRIFFLTFQYAYGGHKGLVQLDGNVSNVWLSRHEDKKDFKCKIDLVERFLIHFFKPIYNRQHVDCEIQDDTIVKDILIKNEVETVTVNYGVYGNGFQFWSPRQALKSEVCSFNFNKPENYYYAGL